MVYEDKIRVNPHYFRKKLECVDCKKSVYLSSSSGIRCIVDEILFLNDGTAVPLDYKYAEYKACTFKNHKYQLTIYGRLIRGHFNVPVNRGFIIYTRNRNKLIEVPITEGMYMGLDKIIIGNLLNVVQKGVYPKLTKYKDRMQRLLLQKYLRKSDLKSEMKGDKRCSRRLSQGPYELLQKTITAFVESNIRYIVTGS